MNTQTECPICCERLNRSTRKPVACPSCQATHCQECTATFLIENTIVPKCMSCRAEWNTEFLRGVMPRTFMEKRYRDHQKDALLAEAETTVGALQTAIARDDEVERRKTEILNLKTKMAQLKQEIDARTRDLYQFQRGEPAATAARAVFIMACPADDCRGQLSTGYKCGLCSKRFCARCHREKTGDDHACAQEDVDTVALLRENTKPCPKCGQGIYKVSGCDQMWCVSCHTCFSWRTGNILNGTVHNPHFFEYQRRHGIVMRNPGDIPCGGMPHSHHFTQAIRSSRNLLGRGHFPAMDRMEAIYRFNGHIIGVTMRRIHRLSTSKDAKQQEHGKSYLRRLISRERWRDLLYRSSKEEEKYRRYYSLLQTLTTGLADQLREWFADVNGGLLAAAHIEKTTACLAACDHILGFAREEMDRMRRQFQMTLPVLEFGMDLARV